MWSKDKPRARENGLVVQILKDEVLIYDLKTEKMFCLNQTAAFVWQQATGDATVKQIASLLQRHLRTAIDESVVWFALEQLEKDNLLESRLSAPLNFAGMNRRRSITSRFISRY